MTAERECIYLIQCDDFDFRFSLRVCPLQVVGDVEECCEKEDTCGLSCSSFMEQPSKDPSPFMSKRVIHESNTHHHSACQYPCYILFL